MIRPAVPRVVLARDASAAELGEQVRSGALVRVLRGVYVAPARDGLPWEADQHLLLARAAGVHARRDGCWFSHRTAAVLWGCDVATVPTAVDVTSRSRRRSASSTDAAVVRDHWSADTSRAADVTQVLALPATSLARTAVDCATSLPGAEALVVVDSALRMGADPALLAQMLESAAGGRGVRTARTVLARADARAESVGETLVRWWIAEAGLPAPDLQVAVRTRLGWRWLDLGWPDLRLALEFDGRTKYGTDGASAARALFEEKRRQEAVEDEGWSFIRVTWRDLGRPSEITARVARALQKARRRSRGQ